MAFIANHKQEVLGNSDDSQVETKTKPKKRSLVMSVLAMALCFAALFAVIAVQPAAAAEINLTAITDIINAFISIIQPLTNLVISIVPLWFVMQILAFIMGLIAAILAMIKFSH